MSQLPAITVLGTRVHAVRLEEAVAQLEAWIQTGASGRWVVASGMHAIMEGWRRPAFQALINQADLFVPDGYSVVWLARRYGAALPGRVCGTDLLTAFCETAARKGYRVFFYGDTEEVLARLRARLLARWPSLQIAGTYSPPFRPLTSAEDAEACRRITEACPDIVWVGLGLPKQEHWIAEHQARLPVPVFVAVGAAFKFVSGDVRRAPAWIGAHGLEWAWRLLMEPRKMWRRALDVPVFTTLALLELLRRMISALGKRVFDCALALSGLVVSLPLWAVIAACIKLEDGGPVFYAQPRVGWHGRRFLSVKFRTMIPDADQRFGPLQAAENDPRMTRVGRFLRAMAMDELPQLWNIAKGDMSFVGPRPLAPGEIEINGRQQHVPLEAVQGFKERHRVRPGLTGVAQIYAPRDVPRRHKFRYDQLYISRQSLWLDLRLVLMSFWISFRGKWESRCSKL